jgi:large subunit ribosomal protein L14e
LNPFWNDLYGNGWDGIGTGVVKKYFEKEDVVAKWDKSSWAQKRAAVVKRKALGDFHR